MTPPMCIRAGQPEELEAIFMMGFDTWNEGMSERDYLDKCLASPKYPQGDWLVLERGAELVSSLIVYRSGFELPDGCWGIGSVATPPGERKQGYAAQLLEWVLEDARAAETRGLYLFSGIDPTYYAKFGFEPVTAPNPRDDAVCMALCRRDREELIGVVPSFFRGWVFSPNCCWID